MDSGVMQQGNELMSWCSAHLSQYSRRDESLMVLRIIRVLGTRYTSTIDAVDHEICINICQPLRSQ